MSEKLKESLSAIIDDEADEFELRRVLDEMERDDSLLEAWRRYHLASAVMRGQTPRPGGDLRERVWAALDLEPAAARGQLPPEPAAPLAAAAGRRLLGPVAGVAVAAAVALGVVLTIGGLESETADPPQVAVTIDGPKVALSSEVSAGDVKRANAYMMYHVQQQAMNQPGVASFVKLVTYERP